MPVPTAFSDLSTTAASNSPADTEQRTTADDYFRQAFAFIRSLYEGASNGQLVFPATQNPSSNANTLDDYEEGAFTPVDGSGAGLSFSVAVGNYVKIGKLVTFRLHVTYPSTASASDAYIGGLPFSHVNDVPASSVAVGYVTGGAVSGGLIGANAGAIQLYNGSTALTNVGMSEVDIYITGSYEAAT